MKTLNLHFALGWQWISDPATFHETSRPVHSDPAVVHTATFGLSSIRFLFEGLLLWPWTSRDLVIYTRKHHPSLYTCFHLIIIIINLIYIAQFDTNGILTALYIVITYIQMQYVHVCTYTEQSYKYTYTCLHIHTYTVTCTNIHLPTY